MDNTTKRTEPILSTSPPNIENGTADPDRAYYYSARLPLTLVFLALSLYLLMMLLLYEYRLATIKKLNVNHLIVVSALNVVINCLSQLCELKFQNLPCVVYHVISVTTFALGMAMIYTVVWARQRKLYTHPLLAKTVPGLARRLSTTVIVVFYIVFIVPLVLFTLTYQLTPTEEFGCVIEFRPNISFKDIVLPVILANAIGAILIQCILFLLIVYPLFLQTKTKNISMPLDKCCCLHIESDIHKLLLRLAISTLFCTSSTISTCGMIAMSASDEIHVFWPNLTSADLLINTVFTVTCFANWRKRLFPLLYWKKKNVAETRV